MKNELHAEPLSIPKNHADLAAFHALSTQVIQGYSLNAMLAALGQHLNGVTVTFCAPDDPPPSARRITVVPVMFHERHLGDVFLELTPDDDSIGLAARLTLFVPIIALAIACQPTGNSASQ